MNAKVVKTQKSKMIQPVKQRSFWFGILIAAVFFLAAAGFVFWSNPTVAEENYYAFFLENGDLYFGKVVFSLSRSLVLDGVYFLRSGVKDGESSFSIESYDAAFWDPVGRMEINPDKVVWRAKLRPDSRVVDFIKEQRSAPL